MGSPAGISREYSSSDDASIITAFLSSTSYDLREHRIRVADYCARFGYGFRMMEEFGAQDGTAVQVSVSEIAGCQVFVGIYARRYGFVPPGSEKGITEAEYDAATNAALPRLIFVLAPDYADSRIESHRDDRDPVQRTLLQRFLERVAGQLVWETFTTPEHLANRVAFAISKWEGWRPKRPDPMRYRYIGREALIQEVESQLTQNRRAALIGIGGIGKTLTAVLIAHRSASRYPGGVLWVNLGTEARDPEQTLQSTMRAWAKCHHPGRLTVPANLTPETVRRWLTQCPGRLLVVLDDIWHARVGQELLRLVPDTVDILVTSRRADTIRQLGLRPTVIGRLSQDEAVALLRDRVGDLPTFHALRRISELLGGHPLALEIVSAKIASGPPDLAEAMPEIIAARMRDDPVHGLTEIEAEVRPPIEAADSDQGRYASVTVALGITYDTFAEDLKRRFRAIGSLAPDVRLSESLLAAVWNDDLTVETVRAEFETRTAALVSASVLTREGLAFTCHPLVRLFALQLGRLKGDNRIVENRYVAYVLKLVLPRLQTIAPERWDMDIGDELPHVQFVGDRLVERLAAAQDDGIDGRTMAEFAAGVEKLVEYRRELHGIRWFEAAAAACEAAGDRAGQIRFLNAAAGCHFSRRDSRNGLKAAYAAWQLALEQKELAGQARAALYLGYHYMHTDPWEAPGYFEGAARQFEEIGDPRGRVDALIQLADCKADSINAPPTRRQGFDILHSALQLAREAGHRIGEVNALIRLGVLHETCAEREAARDRFQEALAATRALGSRGQEATVLLHLAGVLADLGDMGTAATLLGAAAQLFEEVGDLVGFATALRTAAQVAELEGMNSRAAALYVTALPLARRRTFQELDMFSDDDMRAARTLSLRLDDVLSDDTREQYRAKLADEIASGAFETTAAAGRLMTGQRAPMPEDVCGFLLRQTIRATCSTEEARVDWNAILRDFAGRLDAMGEQWSADAEFVRSLAAETAGLAARLPEQHLYSRQLTDMKARLERKRRGLPTYGSDELRYFLGNTHAVLTKEKDKVRDWAAQLRKMRAQATNWGEREEAEFFGALLGLTVGRLASVSIDSPYSGAIQQIEDTLSAKVELLADYVERVSIARKVLEPDQLAKWCGKLRESLELATLWRDEREREYLKELLGVLEDRPGSLPTGHIYARSLEYVKVMVSRGIGPPRMSAAQIRSFVRYALRAASAESERATAGQLFSELIKVAESAGDVHEEIFFRALLEAVDGNPIELPRANPYRAFLEARMGMQLPGS